MYSLTAEGREQLRRWLKVPVAEAVPRNELLLKLFFGAQVSPSVSREHVQAYLESHQKELQIYGAIAKRLRKEEANDPQLPFWLMTLSMGRHRSAAMVKWCKETLEALDGAGANAKRRQVMHAADPMWMRVFLGVHIAAGASSFLLAPVALATAKGGKQHRRWGKVYLWSMGVVAATALPMALYRPVLFLALVAVFSFYLAFSGFRVTRLKELARGGSATPIDWIAAVMTFVASACLAGFGAFRPAWVQQMGIVCDCVWVYRDGAAVAEM